MVTKMQISDDFSMIFQQQDKKLKLDIRFLDRLWLGLDEMSKDGDIKHGLMKNGKF